jgi:peptidylprolyl isomerase
MGTDKRERQKAGRQARVEAAREAQRKAETRRRILLGVAVVAFIAAAIAILAFVTRDDDSDTATTTTVAAEDSAAGKPCVPFDDELPAGAPEVPIEAGPPPTELVTEDLIVGEGDEVPEGASVTVNYIGVSCSTGKIFDSSWQRGEPATFPLSSVITGWGQGIPGMRVGGQRLLIVPPDLGYGPQGSPPNIAPDETLYFVVDLVSFEGAAESAAGKPCVARTGELPEGAPEVPVEEGPPPTELVIEDLVVGEGDEVAPGATVTVNYIGVACSTGEIFDSSWERGEPATFALDGVIAGWTEGIPGMQPGGQRLLVIPPDMAYGPQGSPPAIAPDETLYFVVDLVSVEAAPSATP